MISRTITVLALSLVLARAGTALAQESTEQRMERLERELTATRARLEAVESKQAATPAASSATASAKPEGGPSAAAEGEKFEKKFGEDAVVTWKDGFQLLYLDREETDPERRVLHRFAVRTLFQFDGRAYPGDDHAQHDRFFVRRARIAAEATLWRYHDARVEMDLGQSTAKLTDGWLNFGYVKWLQLRVGHFKEPFLLEHETNSKYLNFIEFDMMNTVANVDFDFGASLRGDLWGYASYALAIQNGEGTNKQEANDDKDFNGQILLTPWKPGGGVLKHLLVGVSGSYGHQTNFVPVYRTEGVQGGTDPSTPAASQFLVFAAPPAGVNSQQGGRSRWALAGRYSIAPVAIQAEYSEVNVEGVTGAAGNRESVLTRGFYVDLLFMITGEEHPFSKRIVPEANFDPLAGGWGAWELALRWDYLHADNSVRRDLGGTGADVVNGFVTGVNWYLNSLVKIQLNYNHNRFNHDAANTGRDSEDVLMARFEVEF